MRIQHNIAAVNAHRQLGGNNSAVAKNLEKLSSGYRINKAGDDAAGLSISEKMRAQIKGLETAQKNAQDGVSLIQTAEGNLTEVHSMLNRMVELSTQSANGTYANLNREELQKEVSSLTGEIDRIASSANFNGIKLLDGSLGGSKTAGGLTGASIASFKGAETGATTGGNASAANAPATTGKYTYDIAATIATGDVITFKGVATADVTYTAAAAENNDATKAAAKIVADIQGAAGYADGKWTVTQDGSKVVFTNKVAGDNTAMTAPSGAAAAKAVADGGNAAGAAATGIDYTATDTIKVDGTDVKIDWSGLTDADKAMLKKNFADTAANATTADDMKNAAKVLQDTINASIDKQNAAKGTNIQHIKVEGTDGGNTTTADTFKFISGQKDGDSSIEFKGSANSVLGLVAGSTAGVKSNAPVSKLNFSPADISGKSFDMEVDGEKINITLGALAANATADDVVTALNAAINTAMTNYDTAKGLTGTADATAGKVTAKLNSDGAIEFNNTSGKKIGFADKADGEVAKTLGISKDGKASATGGLTLQVGETSDDFQKVTVTVGNMNAASLGLGGINISTQDGASAAMDAVNAAIDQVSSTRGDLGALQNRLDHTINNLGVTNENMTAAESRIRDVDMAKEMMDFTKNNILTQAAQAMLAQANNLPQGVLQLLK